MAAEGRSFGEALDSSSRSDPVGPKSAARPSGTNEAAAALLVFFGNDLQSVRDHIHQSGKSMFLPRVTVTSSGARV
jgi:hypothetical protein